MHPSLPLHSSSPHAALVHLLLLNQSSGSAGAAARVALLQQRIVTTPPAVATSATPAIIIRNNSHCTSAINAGLMTDARAAAAAVTRISQTTEEHKSQAAAPQQLQTAQTRAPPPAPAFRSGGQLEPVAPACASSSAAAASSTVVAAAPFQPSATPAKRPLDAVPPNSNLNTVADDGYDSDVVEIMPSPPRAVDSSHLPPFKKVRRSEASSVADSDCQIVKVQRRVPNPLPAAAAVAASLVALSPASAALLSIASAKAQSERLAATTEALNEWHALKAKLASLRNVPAPITLPPGVHPPPEDERDDLQPAPSSVKGGSRVDKRQLINPGNRCWQVTALPRVMTEEEKSADVRFELEQCLLRPRFQTELRWVKQRGGESRLMGVQVMCGPPAPSIKVSPQPPDAASAGVRWMAAASSSEAAGPDVVEIAAPPRSSYAASADDAVGQQHAVDEIVCKRLTRCMPKTPQQLLRLMAMQKKVEAVIEDTLAHMRSLKKPRNCSANAASLSTAASVPSVSFRYDSIDDDLFDYRVSWENFPSSDDTWQSYDSVRDAWQAMDHWARALTPLEAIFQRMNPSHPPAHETVTIE